MYGSDLVVGARNLESVEHALRRVLPSLGLVVARAFDVANVSERYELTGTSASVSFGALDDGVFCVAVHGPFPPVWHRALGERLSQTLGGIAAGEMGYFLFGHSLAEDGEGRGDLERLAGPFLDPWPPKGAFRVLIVDGSAEIAPGPPASHATLAVAAGAIEGVDLPGEVVDGNIAVIHSELPIPEILARLARPAVSVFATDGTAFWSQTGNEAPVEFEGGSRNGFLRAWESVERASGLLPIAITFGPPLSRSPFR